MNTKLSALALLVITMTLPATATEQDKELRQLTKQAEQSQPATKKALRGSIYEVQFDDWMYLMNDQIMINKASMSKFGIYLGEVTLTFVKENRSPS